MNVLVLTVFVTLILVGFFLAFFVRFGSGGVLDEKRDSLLPFQEEKPRSINNRNQSMKDESSSNGNGGRV